MKKKWIVFPVALALITGLMLMALGCDSNVNETKTLESIAVTTLPNKVQYALGANEELDTEGMVVTATYTDGSTAPVTGYTTSGFTANTLNTLGPKTITVIYEGKRATFSINVINPDMETVATPVASPVAGTVFNNTQVTLTTATSGAQIWYTTNGNIPARDGAGSYRYITPIPITAAVTITAIAIRDGWNDSGLLTAAYTVQTDAYTVTQLGGTEYKKDSEYLVFTFGSTIPRDGLVLADITITDGTGSVTPVSMTNSAAPSRNMVVVVNKQGTVNIKINRAGTSAEERTATVYKKTGYEEDPSLTLADVVKMGGASLPPESPITFALSDGDPIAKLPPRTTEPITTALSAANPAFEHVIAVFDPPLDLTTTPTRDFRWFDMVWDGFGSRYEFDGTVLELHQVTFQLELTTSDDSVIVFQKRSDTDTSTDEKKPVRFLKADITAASPDWGNGQGSGHRIKKITVRATGMQFRNQENSQWPNISATNAPVIDDTWIKSLVAHTVPAPLPKVLYDSEGWSNVIVNPRWALRDVGAEGEASADPFPEWTGEEGVQKIVYWDPIDAVLTTVNTAGGFTVRDEYSTIIITLTGTVNAWWYAYGSISGDPAYGREGIIKQQAFDGGQINPSLGVLIPLRSAVYTPDNFDATQFSGFYLQWNSGTINITSIKVE
jgi:hypothetical protein